MDEKEEEGEKQDEKKEEGESPFVERVFSPVSSHEKFVFVCPTSEQNGEVEELANFLLHENPLQCPLSHSQTVSHSLYCREHADWKGKLLHTFEGKPREGERSTERLSCCER